MKITLKELKRLIKEQVQQVQPAPAQAPVAQVAAGTQAQAPVTVNPEDIKNWGKQIVSVLNDMKAKQFTGEASQTFLKQSVNALKQDLNAAAGKKSS